MRSLTRWTPAVLLGLGSFLLLRTGRQEVAPLRAPLDEVPREILGLEGRDLAIDPEQERLAGMSSYSLRSFRRDSLYAFSVYVGYYDSQNQGQTIHSPKNCLPGAGWEPVDAGTTVVAAGGREYTVNRYLLANGPNRSLVYYWYQGRGRISANEYAVKWELLRDKALHGRSEEALVRIVVPVQGEDGNEEDAIAAAVAAAIIQPVFEILPAPPGQTGT